MNPYAPVATPWQQECIVSGRAALTALLLRSPYSDGQRANFRVDCIDTLTDRRGGIDHFVAKNLHEHAPLSLAWTLLAQRANFVIEHDKRALHLYVPHAYYFRRNWCPMRVDGPCITQSLVMLLLGGGALCVAYACA